MAMLVITRLGISNRFETDFAALDLWTMIGRCVLRLGRDDVYRLVAVTLRTSVWRS
jgi:hypothetical protein